MKVYIIFERDLERDTFDVYGVYRNKKFSKQLVDKLNGMCEDTENHHFTLESFDVDDSTELDEDL